MRETNSSKSKSVNFEKIGIYSYMGVILIFLIIGVYSLNNSEKVKPMIEKSEDWEISFSGYTKCGDSCMGRGEGWQKFDKINNLVILDDGRKIPLNTFVQDNRIDLYTIYDCNDGVHTC